MPAVAGNLLHPMQSVGRVNNSNKLNHTIMGIRRMAFEIYDKNAVRGGRKPI
jgi:hypothetical protein